MDANSDEPWKAQINELAELVKKQSETISGFVKSQSSEQLKGLLKVQLKAKGIPENWADKYPVESEDKLIEVLKIAETDFTALRQSIIDTEFDGKTPAKSQGDTSTSAIETYAKTKNEGTGAAQGVPGKKL